MPEDFKGIRFSGDEEMDARLEEEEKKRLEDEKRRERVRKQLEEEEAIEQEELDEKKVIEESARLNVERVEKLAKINAILVDMQLAEEWHKAFREFLDDVCSDEATDHVIIVLQRVKDDRWVMKAEVGPR